MATLESLRAKTRHELVDLPRSFQANIAGDGSTVRFELPDKPVDAATLAVSQRTGEDPAVPVPAEDYMLDDVHGVLWLSATVAEGTTLLVQGTAYRFFSNEQIDNFIDSALDKHTNRTTVTMETLPPVEEHLVAILAKIEALWVLATDASYDISVFTPEGVSIPREQRYRQIMAMIDNEQQRYRLMSQQLNVGLSRVEVSTLRRISTKTGRLVPMYVPQEFDDRRRPQRMYPGIDEQATTVRPAHLPALPAYNEPPPDP